MGNLESFVAIIAAFITATYIVSATLSETYKFHNPKQTDELRFNYIITSKKTKQLDAMSVASIVVVISVLISFILYFALVHFNIFDSINFDLILFPTFLILVSLLICYEYKISKTRDEKILTIRCKNEERWFLHSQIDDEIFLFKKDLEKNISDSIGELLLLERKDLIKYYSGFYDISE